MNLRHAMIAATALAVIPAGAQARDGTPYVGLEGGVIKPEDLKLDYRLGTLSVNDGITIEHRTGLDLDLLAGYDFGFIRAEGELGYKRASMSDVAISPAVLTTTGRPAIDGKTSVLSAMANLLLDFGGNDGLGVYAGAGAGLARISSEGSITGPGIVTPRVFDGKDRSFAWQLIAGMRVPVSSAVDLGLKYRYFRSKLDFSEDGTAGESLDGRFKSHSILLSLLINFGAAPPPPPEPVVAPPPPPPPPPPPATQTCPDGSVILATDSCPVPPPPPPPPPPEPVRG